MGGELSASVPAKRFSLRWVFRVLHNARWLVEQAVRLCTRPPSRESL